MLKTTNSKSEMTIIMKKFKKIIAMGCAAIMAMSAMSMSAFAEESDVITEVAHTYITDDNGEMKVIDFEVSIPADATKQESDEILINAAYAARSKSSVAPLSVNGISYNLLLQENNFAIPHNTESGVNNNNTVGTASTTVGTSGLAIVLSSITNLQTFNISFKNITSGVMWFDMDRPVNSGRYVYFPNGEENYEGRSFIYNAGKSYQIKLSGTRYNVAGNSSADVSVYEYTE